jgi:hypothetical protein
MSGRRGQALVELCVVLPLACACTLVAAQALVAASAAISLERALDRAVIAAAAGSDPATAAREALPRLLARDARITSGHGRIRVMLDLPGPFGSLAASARVGP